MYAYMYVLYVVEVNNVFDIYYIQQYKFADFDTVQLKVNAIHRNFSYNVSHYHYGLVV